jgi:hypothetical protein
MSPAWLSFFR